MRRRRNVDALGVSRDIKESLRPRLQALLELCVGEQSSLQRIASARVTLPAAVDEVSSETRNVLQTVEQRARASLADEAAAELYRSAASTIASKFIEK